ANIGFAMNIQFCTGSGQSDTHIYSYQPYQTKTLDDLLEMVREPASVDKDKAQWAILSNYHQFDARNHKAQKEYGSFVLLPVDLDEGAPQLGAGRCLARYLFLTQRNTRKAKMAYFISAIVFCSGC
ncbi:hypothetical protein OAR30_03560, partial [Euryarchaeota archaeon]|nr:hypothetical protein [Euryarchaeota archaeon]